MKTISIRLIINSFRSRKDHSLGLSAESPELTEEEMVEFMKLQGHELEVLLKPTEGIQDIMEVKGEFDTKSPSQRLRATLYVLWEQKGKKGDWNSFYLENMEKFINLVKRNLEDT